MGCFELDATGALPSVAFAAAAAAACSSSDQERSDQRIRQGK